MRSWDFLQKAWALAVALCAVSLIGTCYAATEGGSRPEWPVLIVDNETASIIKVMDEGGRIIGRATGGQSTIPLRFLSYSATRLEFHITGDPTRYFSPPESLWSQKCWRVRISPMAPERDIWSTFLPC